MTKINQYQTESKKDNALLERGVFTFSLDFELAWGTRGRPNAMHMPPFLDGTRKAVHGLLSLFEEHNVSATWATVGAMLLGSEKNQNCCEKHSWLSGKTFDDIPAGDATTCPHWYAEDLVQAIRACGVEQDIGCHTLTHGFVDPSPQGREPFRLELERSLKLFEEYGLGRPTSFIYPKAKMGHFDVLSELGFRSFRGPENKWFESLPGVKLPAALRLLDAKLAGKPKTEQPVYHEAGIWQIPSSQFYSPFFNVGKHVSVKDRVKKAKKGLLQAAQTKGIFHLWTHPFNLGVRTEELLDGMREILSYANDLCNEGELDILSMKQIASHCDDSLALFDNSQLKPLTEFSAITK